MQVVSVLPRIESRTEMSAPEEENELERMLQEAERLAVQMRAAAHKSSAELGDETADPDPQHSGNNAAATRGGAEETSQASSPMILLDTILHTGETEPRQDVALGVNDSRQNAVKHHHPRPPPPPHPPRQASGSTIDTAVPVTTVQIPPHPPSVDEDALSLPSNIHDIVGGDNHNKSSAEMEAVLRATQNMEKALAALGASVPEEPQVVEKTATALPSSTPAPSSPDDSSSPLRGSSHSGGGGKAMMIPPPPPPVNNANTNSNDASSSSLLPQEGDADYAELKDYSFKPSKFTPDDSVTWEQVDIAHDDDDVVQIKDYSKGQSNNSRRVTTTPATLLNPLQLAKRKNRLRRRRRRRVAAALLLVGLLGCGYYYYFYYYDSSTTITPDESDAFATRDTEPVLEDAEPPVEAIHVHPLPWVKHDRDNSMAHDEEEHVEPEEEDDDEEKSFVKFVDMQPPRSFRCALPLAFLLPGCHDASFKERVDFLLQGMLI